MARPGVTIIDRTAPPNRGVASDTGVWFVAGLAEKGPVTEAVPIRNMGDFELVFGTRVSYGFLWDAADVFFKEGGALLYVSRVVGPGAVTDTVTLNDAGAAASIRVSAIGPGATELAVQVIAGDAAGTFRLVITDNAVEVERSPDLADPAAAAQWGTSSDYVRVTALGANDPAVIAATALAGGIDDRASITDTHRIASLDRFTRALGPGQVSFPGATTTSIHVALLEHAQTFHRTAICDAPDSGSNTTLAAAADAIRADAGIADEAETYGGLFAPWLVVPGVARGTTRTVPPSAVVAGMIARVDALTGNPNIPAAGSNGESRFATGLSQLEFSDAIRETLNTEGVNLLRMVYGAVRLYGYRTLSLPDSPWVALNEGRTRMLIMQQADAIGEEYIFSQLDGRGRKIAEFNGALAGMLQGLWLLGALYGETPDQAYTVDTGSTVNTPTTIENRELRAILAVKTSPFAEQVTIEIVKVPITESL